MEQLRVALLLLLILICICSASMGFNSTCKESERKALLLFKQSFGTNNYPYESRDSRVGQSFSTDPLDSWVGHDCCQWEHVGCENVTGNVIKLALGGLNLRVAGEVKSPLLELKSLRYLDLSSIHFYGYTFPEFFGLMRQLEYLDLTGTSFTGKIPRLLGNLTNLVYLGLEGACLGCGIEGNNLEWAFRLEKLETFHLTLIDLSQALDTLHLLEKLPSLSWLGLAGCRLGNSHQLPTNSNISSTNLQHLYLGNNLFSGPIPLFIQNLSSIKSLDLADNQFNGSFPHFIQRSSFLTILDLSHNEFRFSIPSWLANNISLEYLSLSNNEFNRVDGGILNIIVSHCKLKHLDLSYNQLREEVSGSQANFSRCSIYELQHLDISHNYISGYFPIIGSLTPLNDIDPLPRSLLELSYFHYMDLSISDMAPLFLLDMDLYFNHMDLSHNNLSGVSPVIGNLSSLRTLDLSYNNLDTFPPIIESLSSLKCLILSHNNIKTLPPIIESLSSLRTIDLSYNNLDTLPPMIESLSSLKCLILSHNNIKTLPPSLGELSSLESLDLSHNNLSIVHQISLANLSNLTYLNLSSNSLLLDLSPDWTPPFQLSCLIIPHCKLNNSFPKWILSQRYIEELDLSDTGIYGALPHNIGNTIPNLQTLRLARNNMSGPIPSSLCGLEGLEDLDLQKNRFSGMIPDCWANSPLIGVELSSNRLSGRIPDSLAEVSSLQLLSLSHNSLHGELPLQLSNSARLTILDLGRNNLHGEIPPWNGANFPILQILILRENSFNGTIPEQLCSFRALQIIDLARNNFVGTIPGCFGNFRGMGSVQHSSDSSSSPPSPPASNTTTDDVAEAEAPTVDPKDWSASEVIKGAEREYTSVLHLLVNMDLSCNNLVGAIPAEISNSNLLIGLNLSHNHLNGTIPMDIGEMKALESLDLSFNNLSGSIPEGISLLDSLSAMNLSFNNLQGSIPTSRHQQTLNDSSIYMGNPGLCGEPVPKKCFPDDTAHPPTGMVVEDEEDDKHEKMWFYLIIVFGFATGFWGVIGTLVVSKKWRYAYFGIAEELADWIYVRVAVRIAQANRRG